MAWVRLDDGFYDHPKFSKAGPLGMAMWVSGLAYCNRNLTDGVIPGGAARRLLDLEGCLSGMMDNYGNLVDPVEREDWYTVVGRLLAAGLWEELPGGDYKVHDYHDYQPTADEVREMRRKKSEAGKAGAEARWGS